MKKLLILILLSIFLSNPSYAEGWENKPDEFWCEDAKKQLKFFDDSATFQLAKCRVKINKKYPERFFVIIDGFIILKRNGWTTEVIQNAILTYARDDGAYLETWVADASY